MRKFGFNLLLAAIVTMATILVTALPADPGPCCFS